jgi:hypothetical protein
MKDRVVGAWRYHIAIVKRKSGALDVMPVSGKSDAGKQEGRQG